MRIKKEQLEFLDTVVYTGDWTLNSEGKVDVDGIVIVIAMNLITIPVKFGKVSGSFDCAQNNLTSLEGCPDWVGGSFNCSNNHLTSLEGCPDYVGVGFHCSDNHLTSLEFAPSEVGGGFYCSNNHLTSLDGCPDYVGGSFNCHNNPLKNYFKNIKEEDFKHWDKLDWVDVIKEYPFLINITKNYVSKKNFIRLIEEYPKTKLYLR
jgi:hypothetical protein